MNTRRLRIGASMWTLVAVCACRDAMPINLVIPDLPEVISHVAFVVESEDRVVSVSPLLPRTTARVTMEVEWAPDVEPGHSVRAWGWTDEELVGLLPSSDANETLRIAEPEDATLPSPRAAWRGELDEEGRATLESAEEQRARLTATWLPACPPQFGEGALVDVACNSSACEPTPIERGCALELDLSFCLADAQAQLVGSFDSSGVFWIEPGSHYENCSSTAPRFGARFDLECPGCRLSGYETVGELEAQIETIQIEPIDEPIESGFEHRRFGYVQGLELHDDLAIVNFKSYIAPIRDTPGCEAPSRHENLHAFALDTLAPVWTSTIPGCLRAFTVDPERDEIVVILHRNFELLRYDMLGRPLGGRTLGEDLPRPTPEEALGPAGMVIVPGTPRTLAITFEDEPGLLVLLDADTLATRHILRFESNGMRVLLTIDEELYVVDDDNDRIHRVDPIDGTLTRDLKLKLELELQRNITEILHHPRTDRIIASHQGLDGGVLSVDRGLSRLRPSIPPPRVVTSAFGLARWPADDDQVLVALTDRAGERRSWLSLLEVGTEASRFQPVLKEVGRGPLRHLKPGPEDAIYGVLTWTGQLVRIRP